MSNFDSPYLGPPVLPDYKLREARDSRHEAQQRDAEFTFLALRNQVEELQAEAAKQGSEVGLLAPFSAEVLHVREVGWTGRNTIHIKGIRAGSEVRLVLHHTQLQMLLVPVGPESGEPAKVVYLVPDGGADDGV